RAQARVISVFPLTARFNAPSAHGASARPPLLRPSFEPKKASLSLEGYVLRHCGIDLRVDHPLPKFGRGLCRIAVHARSLATPARLDVRRPHGGRIHIHELRRVHNAGVTAHGLTVPS